MLWLECFPSPGLPRTSGGLCNRRAQIASLTRPVGRVRDLIHYMDMTALVVDGSGNGYLQSVCEYVHSNPVRTHLLRPEQKLLEYAWSGWPQYLKAPEEREALLRVDRLLG